jgi:hypothetical protein
MIIKWQNHVGGSPITELHQNVIVNLLLLLVVSLFCDVVRNLFVMCAELYHLSVEH